MKTIANAQVKYSFIPRFALRRASAGMFSGLCGIFLQGEAGYGFVCLMPGRQA